MNSKAKVTLTVTAMVMVTLIAVVSIIAVFAARTQNFSSNITVKYTATQIAGKVSAKYYIGPDDTTGTAMTTTGKAGGDTELVFRPQDRQLDPNTLNPLGDIILDVEDTASNTPDKSWVVFEYVFQNGLGTKVDTDYIAKLTFSGTADNVVVTTNTAGSKINQSQFSTITSSISNPANFTSSMQVDHNPEPNYVTTKYFYVKVAINAIGASSTFSGNFTWDLTQAPSPTLDKLRFTLDRATQSFYIVSIKDYNVAGDIVIPSSYTGEDGISKPVTEISNIGGSNITSIYIPDTITAIYSISDCPKLTELTIPSSVTTVTEDAFTGLTGLKVLNYNANAQIEAFGFSETPTIFGRGGLGQNASGTSVIIGDSVTNIPASLFSGESHITNLTIGSGVKTIGERAFANCGGLTNITIPDNVTDVGAWCFDGCRNVQKLTIGKGVQNMGNGAFELMQNLSEIVYNAIDATTPVVSTNATLFANSGTDSSNISIVIGNDVINIPEQLFYYMTTVNNITIGNSVENIGKNAFCESSQTSIKIPESVKTIGEAAFWFSQLEEIIIDSKDIYNSINPDDWNGLTDDYSLSAGTSVKILNTSDDNTNEYLNDTNEFDKSTEEINGKQYNVYTKK